MSHKKSKKVFWCSTCMHNIMPSYCRKCEKRIEYISDHLMLGEDCESQCPQGNTFNSCNFISENNQKHIDYAWK